MQWRCLLFGIVFLMTACGKTSRDPANDRQPPVVAEQLTGIAINADLFLSQNGVIVGDQFQLEALAEYDNGYTVVVAAEWSVEPAELASIGGSGLLQAHAEGEVTVTARYSDRSDTLQLLIVAAPKPVVVDLIFSLNDELLVGAEKVVQTFDSYNVTTVAKYSNGEEPKVEAQWTSSNSTIVDVEAGKILPQMPGSVILTASYQGFQKELVLDIIDHPGQELRVELFEQTVRVGSTLTFTTIYQTPDGLEKSVEADCRIDPSELAQFEEGQTRTIIAIEAGNITVTCQYQHLTAQVEITITAAPNLVGLRIVDPGPLELGSSYQMVAIGNFEPGAWEEEVRVVWTLIDDQASSILAEDGSLIARQPGTAVIMAQLNGIQATIELLFDYKKIKISETQFWIYQGDEKGNLSFNFPWDDEPGDDILRGTEGVADFALVCADQAKELLREILNQESYRHALGRVTAYGATSDAIILVNVIDGTEFQRSLRMMDRDAYFWHWNANDKKPVLSMSNFKKGLWVWEVIAVAPNRCIQASQSEMIRYLDYVNSRLAIAK